MAWGRQGNAESDFDKLCSKVASSDTASDSLTVLRPKYAPIWKKHGCAKKLARALATNRSLKELICIGLEFDVEACEAIAEALFSNTTLRNLNIGDETFGDAHVCALLKKGKLGTIEHLSFERRNLTPASCRSISQCLADPGSKISVLNISGNPLTDEGVSLIALGIRPGSCLKEIILSNCGLGSSGIMSLAQALDNANISLKKLDISYNSSIGALGLASLASIQADDVIADACNAGDAGSIALMMGRNRKYVSLGENGITAQGIRLISEMAWLVETGRDHVPGLNLRKNDLGDEGLSRLCRVLEHQLLFGEVKLVPALDLSLIGATRLPGTLLRGGTVSTLLFMGNGPLDHNELSVAFNDSLSSSPSIRALSLTGTGISDLVPVLRSLRNHPSLRTLELGGILLSEAAHEELRNLRDVNPDLDVAIDRGTSDDPNGLIRHSTPAEV